MRNQTVMGISGEPFSSVGKVPYRTSPIATFRHTKTDTSVDLEKASGGIQVMKLTPGGIPVFVAYPTAHTYVRQKMHLPTPRIFRFIHRNTLGVRITAFL